MTLNDVMAVILRHFAKFASFGDNTVVEVVCNKKVVTMNLLFRDIRFSVVPLPRKSVLK